MQIFLDSANPDDVRTAWEWGRIDGVTTNPSLAADAGMPYREIISQIFSIVDGPVSIEVVATDLNEMLDQALKLAQFGREAVIKLPCTTAGLQAAKILSGQKIKTNITLVFSLSQAMLAAQSGATYCSPFVGRLDDVSNHQGDELLSHIKTAYEEHRVQTKIIAASIRDVAHFEEAVTIGVDAVTVPMHVLEKLVKHNLTDRGLQKFLDDWHRSGQEFPH